MVAVEFPLDEAQAILAALDAGHSMSHREGAAAESGRRRLFQAVKVELGVGGAHAASQSAQERTTA